MNILIIGANSAIAKQVARLYATSNNSLFVVSRDAQQLAILSRDLVLRGARNVGEYQMDAMDFSQHEAMLSAASDYLSSIDLALICYGQLPDQVACATDADKARAAIDLNATSVISQLTHLANYFESNGSGCIAVITSVAGDRGRQPNYVYGAAKSMVSTYLQGLRGRMHNCNVQVIDIKPGFVDTPMTADIPKGSLFSSPEKIAGIIVNAIAKKKHTVYAPAYWRVILWIVCSIPENLFKRLKI